MAKKPRLKKEKTQPAKMGRPTAWKDDFIGYGFKLALMGATNEKIADAFGISVKTLETWTRTKPEFRGAIVKGRTEADAAVAHSLYKKATGYYKRSEKATAKGDVVTVREYYPPDTASAIFWLKNRQKDQWKDKHDVNHNHTLSLAQEFEDLIREISTNKALPAPIDITPEPTE